MIGKNNPFNIRYDGKSRWRGLTGSTRGFCDFVSTYYGIRAACILIFRTYAKRGWVSIDQIITSYAPSTENNTEAYVRYVCEKLKLFPFDVVPVDKRCLFLYYMAKFEVGSESPTFVEIYDVLQDMYKYRELKKCESKKETTKSMSLPFTT